MIDIHAHILPGFDDGAQDQDVAVAMLRGAAEEGITHVVATPHVTDEDLSALAPRIAGAVQELNQRLKQESIDLAVLPGAEIHVSAALLSDQELLKDLSMGFRGRYVLLELPLQEIPRFTEELIFRVQLKGLVPVLAHPERNGCVIEEPARLLTLVEKGALVQVNAGSVSGEYGERVRRAAELLLHNRLVHFLASDAHSLNRRPLRLKAAVDRARLSVGAGVSALVQDNPLAALDGKTLEVALPRRLRKPGRAPFSWISGRLSS